MTAAQDQQQMVRINPGMVLHSIRLRSGSALEYCTHIDNDVDEGGYVTIVRNWPGLSTGEELVWRVLAFINGSDRGDLPTWADLRAGLDAINLHACETALATVGCRP